MADETKKDKVIVDDKSTKKPDTKESQSKSEDKSKVDNKSTKTIDTQKEYVSKDKFEDVSKNLSKKDKELSKMRNDIEIMKCENTVKDLIMDAELPPILKSKLKANIEDLSPDNFEDKVAEISEIYDAGKEARNIEQKNSLSKEPSKREPKDFRDRVNSAKNHEELQKIIDESR